MFRIQERIAVLQEECDNLQNKLQELAMVEEENTELRRDVSVFSKECTDKERRIQALLEVMQLGADP